VIFHLVRAWFQVCGGTGFFGNAWASDARLHCMPGLFSSSPAFVYYLHVAFCLQAGLPGLPRLSVYLSLCRGRMVQWMPSPTLQCLRGCCGDTCTFALPLPVPPGSKLLTICPPSTQLFSCSFLLYLHTFWTALLGFSLVYTWFHFVCSCWNLLPTHMHSCLHSCTYLRGTSAIRGWTLHTRCSAYRARLPRRAVLRRALPSRVLALQTAHPRAARFHYWFFFCGSFACRAFWCASSMRSRYRENFLHTATPT